MRAFLFAIAILCAMPVSRAEVTPVSQAGPGYPDAALQAGVEGVAQVRLTIDATGAVSDASLISETPSGYGFGAAAVAAGRLWRFEPGNGGSYHVTMNFTLAEASPGEPDAAEAATGLPRAPMPVRRGKLSYPAAANIRNLDGSVVLIVQIEDDGSVSDIDIFSERPKSRGFGKAARNFIRDSIFPAGRAGRYVTSVHFGIVGRSEYKPGVTFMQAAPKPASALLPAYPAKAHADGVEGVVSLVVRIREGGAVGEVTLVLETPRGHGFADAAIEAVSQWTFPPDTKPNAYSVDVPFRLER